MNNITRDNMDHKSVDIRDRIFPDFVPWFANYMVVKRAAQVGRQGGGRGARGRQQQGKREG